MDLQDIQRHWENWATSFGTELRATTKAKTAKLLEVNALRRRLSQLAGTRELRLLEAGCGNGINCIELAKQLPQARFDAFDFVPEMIEAAEENARRAGVEDRIRFFVGNVVALDQEDRLADTYDVAFTVRCLINLNSRELQGAAIAGLARRVRAEGHLLMIENSLDTYARQNDARRALSLSPRAPAEFNRFFTDDEMNRHIVQAGLHLVEIEDFSSLHDIVLYALLPHTNGGTIDYDHPIVEAAARLSAACAETGQAEFGAFGQNRLYVCAKPDA